MQGVLTLSRLVTYEADNDHGSTSALGAPIRPEAYSDRFRVLCREAELRKIDLDYVGHTLAGIMHRAGVAPADAAALLGHTLAVHLSTYVPSTERGARTAASGLGIALTGAV